jgi:hypothetical protein
MVQSTPSSPWKKTIPRQKDKLTSFLKIRNKKTYFPKKNFFSKEKSFEEIYFPKHG